MLDVTQKKGHSLFIIRIKQDKFYFFFNDFIIKTVLLGCFLKEEENLKLFTETNKLLVKSNYECASELLSIS